MKKIETRKFMAYWAMATTLKTLAWEAREREDIYDRITRSIKK